MRMRRLALALAALAFTGCERGCLATWLAEHGVGGADPGGPPSRTPVAGGARPNGSTGHSRSATAPDLGGTDCSDGLARCVGGHIEVSVGGHIPAHCTTPSELPGACSCAWRAVKTCARACLRDDLEVIATEDVASSQLCASDDVLLRPPTPAESASTSICAEENVSCEEGAIRTCTHRGQPSLLLGVCLHGCATGIAVEPADLLRPDGAAAILCQRDRAERR